jgi:hypothetical protein
LIRDLLDTKIFWIKESGRPNWWANALGKRCELRMNDFPEEPLYTVKWGDESLDIDESPPNWSIPMP